MTLERLTERLQEEKAKVGKVDGRRFNSRSRTKMSWEMKNIAKSIICNERKRKHASRSIFTKEELEEYKQIEDTYRQEKIQARESKETTKEEVPPTPATSPTTPRRKDSV